MPSIHAAPNLRCFHPSSLCTSSQWPPWFGTVLSPIWSLIWLLKPLGASPQSWEPEGSRESTAWLPAALLHRYLREPLPRCLLRSPAASGIPSAPLGCASPAVLSGFHIWHRAFWLKIGKGMERWEAAAGGEQHGKVGPCGLAQNKQTR